MLRAACRGALIPPDAWEGTVSSVHRNGIVNLLHPRGFLVSLVPDGCDLSPFALLVPAIAGCSLSDVLDRSVSKNPVSAASGGAFIRIGTLLVDAADSAPWCGDIPQALAEGDAELRRSGIAAGLRAVGRAGGLLGVLFPERDGNPFARRARSLLSANGSSGGFSPLVGLGPGFTPSGDDFIAGVLLAHALTCMDIDPGEREAIRARLPGTTPGGRSLLLGAIEGRFPAYLTRFSARLKQAAAAASEADRIDGIADAVREAVGHGETSGSDAVTGLLYALGGA